MITDEQERIIREVFDRYYVNVSGLRDELLKRLRE